MAVISYRDGFVGIVDRQKKKVIRKIIIPNLEYWTFKSILLTNNEYGRKVLYIKENESIYEVNL